jgi:hypothetical protein
MEIPFKMNAIAVEIKVIELIPFKWKSHLK